MQVLYDAVMTLGRSYEDARSGGWLCGDLGHVDGPKCVNGLITFHLSDHNQVTYITRLRSLRETAAARMAAVALVRVRPTEFDEQLLIEWDASERESTRDALRNPDNATTQKLENILITINDLEDGTEDSWLLDATTASAWFERAFDLLAQDLPDPLPSESLVETGAPDRVLIEA